MLDKNCNIYKQGKNWYCEVKISKWPSIHIVIQLSQHISLSKIGTWSEIMDYIIREMKSEEYCLLSDFLYEAVYIPDGIDRHLNQ